MNEKLFEFISGIIFGLMAIAQLTRLIFQIPVHVGIIDVPLWPSAVGFIIALTMCIWAFRSASK